MQSDPAGIFLSAVTVNGQAIKMEMKQCLVNERKRGRERELEKAADEKV